MPGILVLGDINVDVLARVEAFSGPGGDNLTEQLEPHCGGVGANTALALAKWGVPVRLVGCVGRDWFGDFALRFLKRENIDLSFVRQTDRAMTGVMFIAVSSDGQRTIFGSRGANANVEPPDGHCLHGVQGLHLVGYTFLNPSTAEVAAQLLGEARKRGIWVSLDVGMAPSRRIPHTIWNVAKNVDVLFVGMEEAAALTGQREKDKVLDAFAHCGAREVVVKLGERGCVFLEQDRWCDVPPFSVTVLDTTGSGDAFAAAFLRARLRDWPRAEAALLANAAGAAAATVMGAGENMPEPKKVFDLLAGSRLASEWERARRRALDRLREELNQAGCAASSGG